MTFLLSSDRSPDGGTAERIPAVQRPADRVEAPPGGTRLAVVEVRGVLVLSGEIDYSTRDLVTNAARQLRDAQGRYCRDVVLHAGGVTFVDATGLGALVSLSAEVGRDGRRFRLVGAAHGLRRLSELCGLDAVLGLEAA